MMSEDKSYDGTYLAYYYTPFANMVKQKGPYTGQIGKIKLSSLK